VPAPPPRRSTNPERAGSAGYRVAPATIADLPLLPAIELAAARLFEGFDVPRSVLEETTTHAELADAQRRGLLWVGRSPRDEVVGFVLVHEHGGHAHIEEVDVDPRHGRRGLGALLVRAACGWAAARGLGVTLTTFREVPWNEAFYRRLGFEAIPDAELSPALREILADEAARGLAPERRVAMRWCAERRDSLPPTGGAR
jgi:GNAT superfamily N-acetyltransferase